KYSEEYDGLEQLESRIQSQYASLYLQETWRPTYHWMIQGGVRANVFTEGSYFRLEPRLSIERRQSERLRFQAAYGRYYQFLTLITNETFSGMDVWLTTAEGVRPAWGDQFIVGVKTAVGRGLRVDAELYYRTMQDLFELDPFLGTVSGAD